MATLEDKSLWDNQPEEEDDVGQDILRLAPEEVNNRTRLLENDIKVRRNRVTIFVQAILTASIGHEI